MNQRTHFISEDERPIVQFFSLGPLIKKLPLVDTKIVPPFSERRPTKCDVPLSAPAIPSGRMAIRDDFAPCLNLFGPFCPILPLLQDSTAQRKWKNEQSINCMSGPTKWPPVPLWDTETCGGVRMATALIIVPGSRVWICYPGPGGRSAHRKIYAIKSAQKYNSVYLLHFVLCRIVFFMNRVI